jgi:hypothetical protein
MPLTIKGAANPGLIALPWHLPLEQWPKDTIAALPRGISRHVVRFVRLDDKVLAIKETNPRIARQEFKLLRKLGTLGAPCVVPLAVVTGREDPFGAPLEAALVTAHLQFSLPYRALFSQSLRAETVTRFVDALAVLLVRLHLLGFYWGDVSLSNALFRRDAAEFTAYLVDAETGELHDTLTSGQRNYDLDLARTNIVGEMFDLEAQERLHESVDPLAVADRLVARYGELWHALTETETFTSNIPLHIADRVKTLNDLGFDIGELDMREAEDGKAIVIRPKVVDAGHHARRLMRLTGLDVQENQARRLLNDLDEYRVIVAPPGEEESYAAHQWLTTVFEATVRAVPREFRAKLEPAQIFHEVLDHRWYLAEAAGRDVPMAVAVASYVKNILPQRPDEKAVLGLTLAEMSAERTAEMTAELPQLTEEVMTRPLPEFDGDNTGAWGRSDSYDADEDDDDADDDTDDADADEPVLIVRTTTKRPPPKRTRPSASETTG